MTSGCDFSIRINDTEVTRSDINGFYDFETPFPTMERVVFSVTDPVNNTIFSQIKVIYATHTS